MLMLLHLKKLGAILFCTLWFFSFSLQAQRNVEIGAFAALPVGSFGSSDFPDGAFAEAGWGIVASSRIPAPNVYKRFSIYLHGSWQYNRMNNQAVSQAFTQRLGFTTEVSESRYAPLTATIGFSHHVL